MCHHHVMTNEPVIVHVFAPRTPTDAMDVLVCGLGAKRHYGFFRWDYLLRAVRPTDTMHVHDYSWNALTATPQDQDYPLLAEQR